MAFEGYLEFNGVEVVNIARTALLCRTLGIPNVRVGNSTITRLQEYFGAGSEWGSPAEAPWDDSDAASQEFAGALPLSIRGLDDSSLESSPTEYVTDGGNVGQVRNGTQAIVCSFILVAKTQRGADYGMRWLGRVLSPRQTDITTRRCDGSTLRYLRFLDQDVTADVHRNDVALTRGISVTRRRVTSCSVSVWVTVTLTAGNAFEYSDPIPAVTRIGGGNPTAATTLASTSGSLTGVVVSCPKYDYTPIYDPLYPALVASPTAPDFLPDGWALTPGRNFKRYWCKIAPLPLSRLAVVPLLKISGPVAARTIRIGIWPANALTTAQCGPLFSTVVSYLPANLPMYVEGEFEAAYCWDGSSAAVRRTDSLVYDLEANPVQWSQFNYIGGLMVTLDLMQVSPGVYEGNDQVQMAVSFVPKSD